MTTTDSRSDGTSVVTDGDRHTLYGADGNPIKSWTGNDESRAVDYRHNPDGGYTAASPDGSSSTYDRNGHRTTSTLSGGKQVNWDVDLPALNIAANEVDRASTDIKNALGDIRSSFTHIENDWRSPSGESFELLSRSFTSVANDLSDLLEDAVRRMRASYQNYLEAEGQNHQILT